MHDCVAKPEVDIHYQWSAGEVCFNCLKCGEQEIIISEGDQSVDCPCGRTYQLRHYVAIINERL